MGAFYNGRCYGDAGAAQDAAYGSAPIAQSVGAVSHVGQFVKTGGVWQWVIVTRDSTGIVSQTSMSAPSLGLAECSPVESYADGVTGMGSGGGCSHRVGDLRYQEDVGMSPETLWAVGFFGVLFAGAGAGGASVMMGGRFARWCAAVVLGVGVVGCYGEEINTTVTGGTVAPLRWISTNFTLCNSANHATALACWNAITQNAAVTSQAYCRISQMMCGCFILRLRVVPFF